MRVKGTKLFLCVCASLSLCLSATLLVKCKESDRHRGADAQTRTRMPPGAPREFRAATFLEKSRKTNRKTREKCKTTTKTCVFLSFCIFSWFFYLFFFIFLFFPGFSKKVAARISRGAPDGMRVRVCASAPLCLSTSLHVTRSAAERHRDREAQAHTSNLDPFQHVDACQVSSLGSVIGLLS